MSTPTTTNNHFDLWKINFFFFFPSVLIIPTWSRLANVKNEFFFSFFFSNFKCIATTGASKTKHPSSPPHKFLAFNSTRNLFLKKQKKLKWIKKKRQGVTQIARDGTTNDLCNSLKSALFLYTSRSGELWKKTPNWGHACISEKKKKRSFYNSLSRSETKTPKKTWGRRYSRAVTRCGEAGGSVRTCREKGAKKSKIIWKKKKKTNKRLSKIKHADILAHSLFRRHFVLTHMVAGVDIYTYYTRIIWLRYTFICW